MIHPTAIIEEEVLMDSSVQVGPYAIIRKGVSIGENTIIGSHVEIAGDVIIGKNNRIFKGAYIGGEAQDLHSKKQDNFTVSLGDNNVIREYVTIHRGTQRTTSIGHDNYFMVHSHIAHDCLIGNNVIMANNCALAGFVEVQDNVFISANTVVHQFVKIGKLSMIGGLCRVSQDVPPFSLVAQKNAKFYGLNKVGLKRAGWNSDKIQKIKKIFNLIYDQNEPINTIIQKIKLDMDHTANSGFTDELEKLIEFLKTSQRGIISKCHKHITNLSKN